MSADRAGRPGSAPPATGPARTAGVVLAAGASRRMGPANKLLLEVDGEPLVRRVVRTALAAGLDPVVVVTGYDATDVEERLGGLAVTVARAPMDRPGLGTSVATGVSALHGRRPRPAAAAILLGDMPWIRPSTLAALTGALDPSRGASICVPTHDGRRGNPVVWAATHFPALASLRGARGGRSVLDARAGDVREVAVDDPGVLRDVDRPEDLPEGPTPRGAEPVARGPRDLAHGSERPRRGRSAPPRDDAPPFPTGTPPHPEVTPCRR